MWTTICNVSHTLSYLLSTFTISSRAQKYSRGKCILCLTAQSWPFQSFQCLSRCKNTFLKIQINFCTFVVLIWLYSILNLFWKTVKETWYKKEMKWFNFFIFFGRTSSFRGNEKTWVFHYKKTTGERTKRQYRLQKTWRCNHSL